MHRTTNLNLCVRKSRAVLTKGPWPSNLHLSGGSWDLACRVSRQFSICSWICFAIAVCLCPCAIKSSILLFAPPPRLFKTSCLCKWTGGSHIWVTRLLEVIERLQNGACLILLFQKFSHTYSRQLCLLNEFIKLQKSFEILTYQKNYAELLPFLLTPPITALIRGGAGDWSLAANVLSMSCLCCKLNKLSKQNRVMRSIKWPFAASLSLAQVPLYWE